MFKAHAQVISHAPYNSRDSLFRDDMASIFAEATRKAASARFKQPQLDAEGQEIEVYTLIHHNTRRGGRVYNKYLLC